MQSRPVPGMIRPKLSSLPRAKTEAARYLELHKLATEKSRLEQELCRIAARTTVIHNRLAVLKQQMVDQQNLPTPAPALPPAPAPRFTFVDLTY
ncbi:hypothetical protein [Anthocerotibacter panamensis]|uniref:hypothetical protein n=1 Tax=Anthocerotibacter panamensis TaxID=2857077 RepID=UPI001C40218A|nr:hypothetical protein [Anthocerotibacter panamensis]